MSTRHGSAAEPEAGHEHELLDGLPLGELPEKLRSADGPGREPAEGSLIASSPPIVILGGFLSSPRLYAAMRTPLASLAGQPVWVAPIYPHDWLWGVTRYGWVSLLRRVHRTVHMALQASTTGKVTLVGHSAGGILGRLYLSPGRLWPKPCQGRHLVDHVITLGSPHYARDRFGRAGWMASWVESHSPGAYFAPAVRYTAVAGRLVRGNRGGSPFERRAYTGYMISGGVGEVWGDGLVSVASALLQGARHIVLEGVGHADIFSSRWYGTDEVIQHWWAAAHDDRPATEEVGSR